jgi:hypothetical protein
MIPTTTNNTTTTTITYTPNYPLKIFPIDTIYGDDPVLDDGYGRFFVHDFDHDQQQLLLNNTSKLLPTSEQWIQTAMKILSDIKQRGISARSDPTLYTGALGYVSTILRLHEDIPQPLQELISCLKLVESCIAAFHKSEHSSPPSLLNGLPGALAIGIVLVEQINNHNDNHEQIITTTWMNELLTCTETLALSAKYDEILYGRAGFIMALIWVTQRLLVNNSSNNTSNEQFITQCSKQAKLICKKIIEQGRFCASTQYQKQGMPLMWEWHHKPYLGAAHGVSGILFALLKAHEHFHVLERRELIDIIETLNYSIKHWIFPTSGNFKSSLESEKDRLVHWCHGSPGWIFTLILASRVLCDIVTTQVCQTYVETAILASEVVYRRGLVRRIGICHGVAGNTFVLLILSHILDQQQQQHREESQFIQNRGLCFGKWLWEHMEEESFQSSSTTSTISQFLNSISTTGHQQQSNEIIALFNTPLVHMGDAPCSLFEGKLGVVCLFLDIARLLNRHYSNSNSNNNNNSSSRLFEFPGGYDF